jgi:hypothetical protein
LYVGLDESFDNMQDRRRKQVAVCPGFGGRFAVRRILLIILSCLIRNLVTRHPPPPGFDSMTTVWCIFEAGTPR